MEGIEAWVKHGSEVGWPDNTVYNLCTKDIPALIAYIKALEEVENELFGAAKKALKNADIMAGESGKAWEGDFVRRELRAAIDKHLALAALDGGGDG